jgi:hypothetical protein
MFYKAKVAVCSEIRTKHINAMWAPRRIFLMLNLVVRNVTAKLYKVKAKLLTTVSINPFRITNQTFAICLKTKGLEAYYECPLTLEGAVIRNRPLFPLLIVPTIPEILLMKDIMV